MPGKGESASVSGHCSRPLLSLSRRRILGTVYSSTPTREELLKRAKYRFTSAHTANSWVAFFFSPRKRSFTNPNFSFITANTCSTFERTRRLAPVLRPLHFVNTILVAVTPMGAVLGLWRACPDHCALSAIGLIAPHSGFFAVQ